MSTKDGGPAFPNPGILETSPHNTMNGMSLRDWFAGQALQSIIAHSELVEDGEFIVGPAAGTCAIANFAEFSYLCADFMIAEREKMMCK